MRSPRSFRFPTLTAVGTPTMLTSWRRFVDESSYTLAARNEHSAKPFVWTKSAEVIIQKVDAIKAKIVRGN